MGQKNCHSGFLYAFNRASIKTILLSFIMISKASSPQPTSYGTFVYNRFDDDSLEQLTYSEWQKLIEKAGKWI